MPTSSTRAIARLLTPIALFSTLVSQQSTALRTAVANDAETAEILVPRLAPVVIDGRLSAGEWDGSYEDTLSDGSRLLLRHDREYLYLGFRLSSQGFPSVCATVADTVRILHASAALAAAVYVKEDASWLLRTRFRMAMRSGDLSETGKASQRAFLSAERWLASNDAMSSTEREMQVAISQFDRQDIRLALGVYVLSKDRSIPWPKAAADGCTALRTVQGWIPDNLALDKASWARLTLER